MSLRGHPPEKDGILACLLAAEVAAVEGAALGDVLERLYARGGAAPVRPGERAALRGRAPGAAGADGRPAACPRRRGPSGASRPTDGLKLHLDGGAWVLVRASGTEPVARLYVEAADGATLDGAARRRAPPLLRHEPRRDRSAGRGSASTSSWWRGARVEPRRGRAADPRRAGAPAGRQCRRKPGRLVRARRRRGAGRRGALRRAGRGEAGRGARGLRGGRPAAACASTSARPPAGSPTACCARGARRVHAIDVGHGQLDPRLRDGRPAWWSGRGERRGSSIPAGFRIGRSLATVDVSFISLGKVLPAVAACLADPAEIVALVKPQFEVGPAQVGRGGVVRAWEARRDAVRGVARARQRSMGLRVAGVSRRCSTGRRGTARSSSISRGSRTACRRSRARPWRRRSRRRSRPKAARPGGRRPVSERRA